ncbi:MAG: hypothetical protein IKX36_04645 [Prevotella sp.]|nr:hypothetical protein [Prevotella sp.]
MKHIHLIYTLLFGVAVLLFFGLAYPNHLHHQEQYQLFLFDCDYVWGIVKLPGGVADLLGRFCTQFFLYAWVGALIIAVLLMAVQLWTLRLFNVQRSTFNVQRSTFNVQWFYGLSFVPSFLLWLFLLDENALLGGVWAVLLTLHASWAFDKLPDGWLRRILLVVAVPVLYWIVGPVCVLFFLLQIFQRSTSNNVQRSTFNNAQRPTSNNVQRSTFNVQRIILLVLLLAMPFILSWLPVSARSLWTGIHYHRYPTETPVLLWAAVLSVFVLVLIVQRSTSNVQRSTFNVQRPLFFALVAVCMGFFVWKNSNFKAEKVMQYDFMACHQQWNRIIGTINADKPNNQIGVTVQNLALAMRGLLGDHMFEFNQNGTLGLLPDVERDATSPMPTAEAFYQLGLVNVAQRSVFEAQEAILDFQKSARCYKRLAQTNLINGNYDVARKYLMALQKTLFYRDWANETLPLLGDEEAINKHPEYGRMRQLVCKEDFFFGDRVTPEMLQKLFLSNTDNRLAYEYLMAYYLLTGDLDNFANYVGWGEKLGYEAIPRHFQEALALRWSIHHEPDERMPIQVSPAIAQRFTHFISFIQSPAMSDEGLKQNFGGTYWYYYFNSNQR